MPHAIEPAATARAKCRGCGERIPAGVLRFGERLPNPFADGETTHWFHPECAAFKRPEPLLETLLACEASLDDRERLIAEARRGIEQPRLQRVDGVERDPSGRAQCRACKEKVEKGGWRIRLVFYEDDRFAPAGFVHTRCARAYFGTSDLLPRLRRFAPSLSEADLVEIAGGIGSPE